MKRILPGLFVVFITLAACAAPGGGSPGGSDPDASPGSGGGGGDGIGHPTGAEPILVVDYSGGFVPVQFLATRLPTFVLLGDGRVIMQGAQTLEFPGPALPALIERTLTEEGIQQILQAFEDTNLFTEDLELNGAQNVVADAANTVFTLSLDDRTVTVSIYGLGALPPEMEPPPGIDAGEVEAHRILGGLNDSLLTLDTWLPGDVWESEGWQPYEPSEFRLYVRDVTGQPVEGGDLPEQVREWPTDDDPAAFGEVEELFGDGTRCGVVDGDLGAMWLAELNAANQMTLWTTDGENRFSVSARPVLPHEDPACPSLGDAA
jgi:hypothetical protein